MLITTFTAVSFHEEPLEVMTSDVLCFFMQPKRWSFFYGQFLLKWVKKPQTIFAAYKLFTFFLQPNSRRPARSTLVGETFSNPQSTASVKNIHFLSSLPLVLSSNRRVTKERNIRGTCKVSGHNRIIYLPGRMNCILPQDIYFYDQHVTP